MTTVNAGMPFLDEGVLAAIERHAFSDTSREVGGMLLGRFPADDEIAVSVEAALPALAAVGEAANITFTHAVWADILTAVDRDFPELRIVGWYHTHPGHGVFLSGYDLFIHESFFADRRMTALVIDPQAGELGWFGWDGDAVAETARAKTSTTPALTSFVETRTPNADLRSRSAAALAAMALLLVGAIGGYALRTSDPSVPAKTTSAVTDPAPLASARVSIADLGAQVDSLNQQLAAEKEKRRQVPPAGGAVTYQVRRGDTLWGIAVSMYGEGDAYRRLVSANTQLDPHRLAVGQSVVVPQPKTVAGNPAAR